MDAKQSATQLYYLLEKHSLLTSAWVNMSFATLPAHVQAALIAVVVELEAK